MLNVEQGFYRPCVSRPFFATGSSLKKAD